MFIDVDITAGKHKGNTESREAHNKIVNKAKQQRAEVLGLISRHDGLTMKEVSVLMDIPFNAVSGRGSELKAQGRVYKTGEVRDGSAVLKAVPLTADEIERFLNGD